MGKMGKVGKRKLRLNIESRGGAGERYKKIKLEK